MFYGINKPNIRQERYKTIVSAYSNKTGTGIKNNAINNNTINKSDAYRAYEVDVKPYRCSWKNENYRAYSQAYEFTSIEPETTLLAGTLEPAAEKMMFREPYNLDKRWGSV